MGRGVHEGGLSGGTEAKARSPSLGLSPSGWPHVYVAYVKHDI